jgi:hypothetical protein
MRKSIVAGMKIMLSKVSKKPPIAGKSAEESFTPH